ncbi:hypothetical protein AMECASPLE_002107 [Ameca splendens]|uniref:Uncharacterized protein n=1 Tax=Ameca splendens TaxID=208324 RepID=A0ABV1A4G9_9TELE
MRLRNSRLETNDRCPLSKCVEMCQHSNIKMLLFIYNDRQERGTCDAGCLYSCSSDHGLGPSLERRTERFCSAGLASIGGNQSLTSHSNKGLVCHRKSQETTLTFVL